jgi:hypothetical protein
VTLASVTLASVTIAAILNDGTIRFRICACFDAPVCSLFFTL